jgi:hypothetical protein
MVGESMRSSSATADFIGQALDSQRVWNKRATALPSRSASRLGLKLSFNNAILRLGGEASSVISTYRRLSDSRTNQLITFLKSL